MKNISRISLHGGHSGQFCVHARDRLEEIIQRYIELGFPSVGITEHAPPMADEYLYPDEKALNLTARDLLEKFADYFDTIRSLKQKYRDRIHIFVGMETETCGNYIEHTRRLIARYQPEYVVGSVHHVNGLGFDFSRDDYEALARSCGSYEAMYAAYFDLQHEMIQAIRPFIVGHFDLIRIFDPDYKKRMKAPEVEKRIIRNLKLIKSLNLVMDFNLRPLAREESEPYITASILDMACEMGIPLVPGDDSHGVDEVGGHLDTAMQILTQKGFSTQWPTPILLQAEKEHP